MALLRKTVELGRRSAANFRTDTALDPHRNRDDFTNTIAPATVDAAKSQLSANVRRTAQAYVTPACANRSLV